MRPLLLLALAGLTLAACDSSGPNTPPPGSPASPPDVIVPLAVGEGWVFQTVQYRYDPQTGEPTGIPDTLARLDTVRVVEAVEIEGETWYRLDADRPGPARTCFQRLYANREDGLYRRVEPTAPAYRTVAYPVEAGDVYSVVPPFTLDGDGFHFEELVAVKRTDYPTVVDGTTWDGVLYTSTVQRLYQQGRDYPAAPNTPASRDVYVPNVGFALTETSYFSVRNGAAQIGGRFRFLLTDRIAPMAGKGASAAA